MCHFHVLQLRFESRKKNKWSILLKYYIFQSMSHLCLPLKMQLKWTQCFRSRLSSRRYVVFIRLPVGEHGIRLERRLASHNGITCVFTRYNEFIKCFHQFDPWMFLGFKQLKKKTNFLSVQKSFFLLSFPVEKEIIRNLH